VAERHSAERFLLPTYGNDYFEELKMQDVLFAYLDPGTGSMIWQVIIASFMGIVIVFGIMKNKILSWLGRKAPALDDADEQESGSAQAGGPDERK